MILDFAERQRELTSDRKKPVWQEIVDVTQPPCIGIGIAFAAPTTTTTTTTTTTLKSKQSKDKRTLSTVEHGLTLEGPIREERFVFLSFDLCLERDEEENSGVTKKIGQKCPSLKWATFFWSRGAFFWSTGSDVCRRFETSRSSNVDSRSSKPPTTFCRSRNFWPTPSDGSTPISEFRWLRNVIWGMTSPAWKLSFARF